MRAGGHECRVFRGFFGEHNLTLATSLIWFKRVSLQFTHSQSKCASTSDKPFASASDTANQLDPNPKRTLNTSGPFPLQASMHFRRPAPILAPTSASRTVTQNQKNQG